MPKSFRNTNIMRLEYWINNAGSAQSQYLYMNQGPAVLTGNQEDQFDSYGSSVINCILHITASGYLRRETLASPDIIIGNSNRSILNPNYQIREINEPNRRF